MKEGLENFRGEGEEKSTLKKIPVTMRRLRLFEGGGNPSARPKRGATGKKKPATLGPERETRLGCCGVRIPADFKTVWCGDSIFVGNSCGGTLDRLCGPIF